MHTHTRSAEDSPKIIQWADDLQDEVRINTEHRRRKHVLLSAYAGGLRAGGGRRELWEGAGGREQLP